MAKETVLETLECKRCGHKWTQRMNKKPLSCPACKTYGWNREPKAAR